jgi:hypothetical protein
MAQLFVVGVKVIWGSIPAPPGTQKNQDAMKSLDKALSALQGVLMPHIHLDREEAIEKAKERFSSIGQDPYKVHKIGEDGMKEGTSTFRQRMAKGVMKLRSKSKRGGLKKQG